MNLLNQTFVQFAELPLKSKKDYLEYLIASNQDHNSTSDSEARGPGAEPSRLWRFHHQLPCNTQTRKRRAQLFLQLGYKNKSVCLLGDDDLVSLELAKLGFTDVTVYDCDQKILEQIESNIPEQAQKHIKLKQADFSVPGSLRENFADLVCFDPPYNRKGMTIFALAALKCSKKEQDSKIIMMSIPILFHNKRNDWQTIESLFSKEGFHCIERYKSFNSYPLNSLSKATIYIAGRAFMRNMPDSQKPGSMQFFSDCIIWGKS